MASTFYGGVFEFVARPSIMVECVRILMACLSTTLYPVSARIALCQYAWPAMQFEFKQLIADYVDGNTLFEFERVFVVVDCVALL
jgi:hypothetical protein